MIDALFVVPVVAGIAIVLVHRGWQRRKLAQRVTAEWGRIGPTGYFDPERAAEGWRELDARRDDPAALDTRTWSDLDLDKVLASIDRTRTTLGRQSLYRRLRAGVAWRETAATRRLAERFAVEPELRTAVGVQLAAAGRRLGGGFWVVTRPDLIRSPWWYWCFPVVALAAIASLAAIPFAPRAFLVLVALFAVNFAIRMATAWQLPGILAPMRQMGPLIRTAAGLCAAIGTEDAEARARADDVHALKPLRRIANWVSRDAMVSGEIVAGLWEYLNLLFALDANALFFGARHLRRLAPVLARVGGWVGDVDVALAVASLRAENRPWCIPEWDDGAETEATGLWHPLLEHPVPNDLELRGGAGVIITGANMSGKSTYLRTSGVAAVLARGLETCPAASWRGRMFRVRSPIGRSDDLSSGKSYYQVEADGVVELLAAAREEIPTLFLLDELLRGTNTIERLAAGEAVLRALLDGHPGGSPHAVMVATHDGELVGMLADQYRPFHFQETIGPEGLSFDYRRREGPASTRTAIALLEATGAPAEVIAAARARAEELDRGRLER